MVLFLFWDLIQGTTLHLLVGLTGVLWSVTVITFHVFHDFYNLEYWPVSCRMSPNLGLSDVFLQIRLGLWVWGKYPSCHITSEGTCYHHDITDDVNFHCLHCEVNIFLFPHSVLWNQVTGLPSSVVVG